MLQTIQITNGPSREELFDGLRLLSSKRLIPFCIEKDGKEKYVAVMINSIQAEDGSGQSWNIAFSVNKLIISETFFTIEPEVENSVIAKKITFEGLRYLCEENYLVEDFRKNLTQVKAYYSTKTRKGVITVE